MAFLVFNLTGAPIQLTGLSVRVPASKHPPQRGEGFNVTSELSTFTGPQFASLEAQRPGKLEYQWTDEEEYSTGTLTVIIPGGDTHDIPSDAQKAALQGT